MLLAVAGLCAGSMSAWADEANLTPTADTYFNWASDETKTSSYGSEATLYCGIWQEVGWTLENNPGLRPNNNDVANARLVIYKFDVSAYKGKITSATFKVTATNPSTNSNTRSIYLGYFSETSWTESTTASTSGLEYRPAKLGNLKIGSFSCSQSIAKGATTEVSFTNEAFISYLNSDEDGIVSLIIYGLGQECSVNSKEAATGKPQLVLTYTNETLYTASFTANEGAITPTVNIYSDSERTSPVTNGTLTDGTTYYYTATLTGYNDVTGSFTVSGANPSISFTMTAKSTFTYTVNAVDESDNSLGVLATATVYEGETINLSWSKFIKVGGQWYESKTNTFSVSKTAAGSENVTYKEADIDYFYEFESLSRSGGYNTVTEAANSYSNGLRGRISGTAILYTPALAGGVYTLTMPWVNGNTSGDPNKIYVYVRTSGGVMSKVMATLESTLSSSNVFTATVAVPDGYSIAFNGDHGSSNSQLRVDYITLKKEREIGEILGSVDCGTAYSTTWNTTPVWINAGETGYYKFVNYNNEASANFYENWYLFGATEASENVVVFGPNHSNTATNATYTSKPTATMADLNGATVELTVQLADAGDGTYTLTTTAVTTKADGSTTLSPNLVYQQTKLSASKLKLYVSVENCWLEIIQQAVKKDITAAGYATYYSSNALDFANAEPSLTASIVTGATGSTLDMTDINDAPAETGVILAGDAGTYTIPVIASSSTNVTGNKLEGVHAATAKDANSIYVLMASPKVGFYSNNKAFTVGANTAYLPIGFATLAPFYLFDAIGGTTGIDAVNGSGAMVNGEYYNLAGQRVAQPTKGLYIVNGKKVVVK